VSDAVEVDGQALIAVLIEQRNAALNEAAQATAALRTLQRKYTNGASNGANPTGETHADTSGFSAQPGN